MNMGLGDLNFKIGSVNPSGIGCTIYRIRKSQIKSWPTLQDDPDAMELHSAADLATLVGDFVLEEKAVFEKFYSTQGLGKITYETSGETDSKMFINKGEVSFPDLSAEALGFAKASVNDDYVYIVKSAGRYHVIGSADYRCVTSPAGDSGAAPGSAKGVKFSVECPDVTPLPIYAGQLPVQGGSYDLSTGVFSPTVV